jgi:ribosomal protein L11 methyltransferase
VNWLEISVTADNEAAEAVTELFNRYVHGSAVTEAIVDQFEHDLVTAPAPIQVTIKGYLPLDSTNSETRRRLEEGLWHLGQIHPIAEPTIREIAEADWANAWKQQYHRLRVGHRIVIVPVWEKYSPTPGEITIHLEPGMAFGTGLHPSTRLCLEKLEHHLRAGSSVLDVGTGSGVLAIAAAKLDARSVLALDADPVAVTVAEQNIEINKVSNLVTVRHGSLPGGDAVPRHFIPNGTLALLDGGQFDLVLANILAPVINSMAPALAARTAPGGHLIVSGLIDSQEKDMVQVLQDLHLEIIGRTQEKDWVALVARKPLDSEHTYTPQAAHP